MWSETLSTSEVEATEVARSELNGVSWAKPLLSRLDEAGGYLQVNKPLMFEIRYAAALHAAGARAEYEYSAVSDESTVDFALLGEPVWLIECVSIQASDAAKKAVRQVGLIFEQHLSSAAGDQRQSPQGEMILAEQKIGEKVVRNGRAIKFPPVKPNQFHMVFVDARGYLDGGGDNFDYRQMVYGAPGIPADFDWLVHWWQDAASGKWEPVKGLFEKGNPLASARHVQERIHFIGFVREEDYLSDEIRRRGYVLGNPWLFESDADAREAWNSYPIQPLHE